MAGDGRETAGAVGEPKGKVNVRRESINADTAADANAGRGAAARAPRSASRPCSRWRAPQWRRNPNPPRSRRARRRGNAAGTQQPAASQADVPRPAARPAATKRAGTAAIARDLPEGGALDLMANKSIVLKTRVPYKNVSISQPEIADVTSSARATSC